MHPDDRTYTWTKFNGKKQSRLDFFLVSSSLMPFVQTSSIVPGFCSDHSAIELEMDFSKLSRWKGFWKFNASLLGDQKYRDLIKNTIKRVTAQYAIVLDDENFYVNASKEDLEKFFSSNSEALQHIPLKINSQSFLDVLLLEIRRETMQFAARKKRKSIAHEQKIVAEIEVLENKMNAEQDEAEMVSINKELQVKKRELENIYAIQAEGAFTHARAETKIEGEKPSRLFCSLEKHNAVQKHVPKLIVEKNGRKEELNNQNKLRSKSIGTTKTYLKLKMSMTQV